MTKFLFAFFTAGLLCIGASGAEAGIYTDDLTRCFVKSLTPEDDVAFMQWIFSDISLHPAVQPLASITNEQRMTFDDASRTLFVHLLTVSCRSQAVDALKYEGSTALVTSFQIVGQVAVRELMTESHVREAMHAWAAPLKSNPDLKSLLKDAGQSPE